MLAMSAEWGFACHEETNWIWSPSTAHAETNSKATSKSSSSSFITEISYYHDWERLQQYTVHDSYARLARDTTTDFHNPTQYPTLGRYAHHMQIQIPHESSSITDNNNTNTNSNNSSARTTYRRLVPVCYGGNFLFHSGGNSGSASRTASADGTTTTNSMVTEESNTKVPRYHQWYYHSQQFWKRIEVSLSRSNNIIEVRSTEYNPINFILPIYRRWHNSYYLLCRSYTSSFSSCLTMQHTVFPFLSPFAWDEQWNSPIILSFGCYYYIGTLYGKVRKYCMH